MTLICTGRDKFDPAKFDEVRNTKSYGHILMKPKGGIWTSPLDSTYGWKDWCKAEGFMKERLDKYIILQFTGTLYVIDGLADLLEMPINNHRVHTMNMGTVAASQPYNIPEAELDFVSMKKQGIDAIHLTIKGEHRTRFSSPWSLYGWDCETVYVMNQESIKHQQHETNKTQLQSRKSQN